MKVIHAWPLALCCCLLIAGDRPVERFDQQGLHVLKNKNGVGGKLVFGHGQQQVDVYAFEKSMKYLISPDSKRIVVTDTGGTASFSIFIIDCKLKPFMLDHKIYRLKPELKNYSSVYPSVRKWASNNSILLDIEAFGSLKKELSQRKINFQVTVEIPKTDPGP